MGIYLFHPMIIYILFYCFGEVCKQYPIISSAAIFITSTMIAILLSDIVRKFKITWIIGE